MSSPLTDSPARPSDEQLESLNDTLNLVYKAYSMDVAIDCLWQMQRHVDIDEPDVEKRIKRASIAALCRKFLESEHEKALIEAYKALRGYLRSRGMLPVDDSPSA